MISRPGKGNFLTAHYDWLVAGIGVLALAGAVAFCLLGGNIEEEVAEVVGRTGSKGGEKAVVAEQDMSGYVAYTNVTKVMDRVAFVGKKASAFFASGKRLLCCNTNCAHATPEKYDASKNLVCAFCGVTQQVAKVEVAADADEDGLPDAWEVKYGLNPKDPADANADGDGDEFTNLEEYAAGTDPTDRKSHPDYLDSLNFSAPLKETYMPFVFLAANKIPTGWRCEFFDARQKDDYGRLGRVLTAVVGEPIGKSGYVLRNFEKKTTKRSIKGSVNKKEVDVSEVIVERQSDGKKVTLVMAESKKAKPAPVDVQATLTYNRGSGKTLEVVAGSEIVLSGTKYKIVEVRSAGKGAVVVEGPDGKKRTITCP